MRNKHPIFVDLVEMDQLEGSPGQKDEGGGKVCNKSEPRTCN